MKDRATESLTGFTSPWQTCQSQTSYQPFLRGFGCALFTVHNLGKESAPSLGVRVLRPAICHVHVLLGPV